MDVWRVCGSWVGVLGSTQVSEPEVQSLLPKSALVRAREAELLCKPNGHEKKKRMHAQKKEPTGGTGRGWGVWEKLKTDACSLNTKLLTSFGRVDCCLRRRRGDVPLISIGGSAGASRASCSLHLSKRL